MPDVRPIPRSIHPTLSHKISTQIRTSSNRRLESAFDVTGLERERSKNNATRFTDRTNRSDKPRPISIPGCLLRPCKNICGGCQMCVPRSTDQPTTSPIKSRLKSVLGSVLPTSNAISRAFFLRRTQLNVRNSD